MTLILGYIYQNSVHLVADSAETLTSLNTSSATQIKTTYTSFGELEPTSESSIISENAQKLYNFNDEIILTFAGDVTEGNSILLELHELFSKNNDQPISNEIATYFKNKKPSLTNFIIGFLENENAHLFCYKDENRISDFTENNSYAIFGSGSENELFTGPILFSLEQISRHKTNFDNFLVGMISIIQSASLNFNSINKGVGGFFNGLSVTKSGVQWAKDTCITLYSSKNFEAGERFIVTKYNRNDATYVGSHHKTHTVYFSESFWHILNPEAWMNLWKKEVSDLQRVCKAEYYAFVCYDRLTVVLLKSSKPNFKEKLELKPIDEKRMGININDSVIKQMLSYVINPETGEEDRTGFGILFHFA